MNWVSRGRLMETSSQPRCGRQIVLVGQEQQDDALQDARHGQRVGRAVDPQGRQPE
ncbi:MAG: hypothetical protein IPO15_24110 [Anaerolineae bacterium]|uniref:hypothetical protein n=1 Tax=Candidatus Amarolinea dominans TaxID=3140696 RepID=UPI003136F418|nr:hypothetical protein [Anaerolineae bacterium]